MTVLIAPSFGNRLAQRHWKDTIEATVEFTREPFDAALTEHQRVRLLELHPGGMANFWGAQTSQAKLMSEVRQGDTVLFTGGNHVRGIGEVGASFTNAAFADLMWPPNGGGVSWEHVYSLRSFQRTLIPYRELRTALGRPDSRDNFMGLRLVRDLAADSVLAALGIVTRTDDEAELDRICSVANRLASTLGRDLLLPTERTLIEETRYLRAEREVVLRRTESLLVDAYKASLPVTETARRIKCSAGFTDLYVTGPASLADLLEAKAAAGHGYVRQALGQLLDYVHSTTELVTSLGALFPDRPSSSDILLLHRYGIDCVYWDGVKAFLRETAPAESRAVWATA